jgi:predicted O-methyltransferase YrrM
MKRYADYELASVSMASDELFLRTLDKVFTENPKVDILESGTYLGMGSTTSLAASLIRNKAKVNKFFTIEADFDLFRQASQNLKKFDFITPIWGLSVSVKEAADFIAKDEAIKNHEKYPDVFIDEIDDPTAFYTNEIEGKYQTAISKRAGVLV